MFNFLCVTIVVIIVCNKFDIFVVILFILYLILTKILIYIYICKASKTLINIYNIVNQKCQIFIFSVLFINFLTLSLSFSKKISLKLVFRFFLNNLFNFFLTLFFNSNVNKSFARLNFDKFNLSKKSFERTISKKFAKKCVKNCERFVNFLKIARKLKN